MKSNYIQSEYPPTLPDQQEFCCLSQLSYPLLAKSSRILGGGCSPRVGESVLLSHAGRDLKYIHKQQPHRNGVSTIHPHTLFTPPSQSPRPHLLDTIPCSFQALQGSSSYRAFTGLQPWHFGSPTGAFLGLGVDNTVYLPPASGLPAPPGSQCCCPLSDVRKSPEGRPTRLPASLPRY